MKLEQKIMKERTDQMHQKVRNGKNGKSEYLKYLLNLKKLFLFEKI